jgi:hypothetical protein
VSEQVFPSAVKFLTRENVKISEILTSLIAYFGDETFPRTQMYDRGTSFKEGRTEDENMRRLHFCRERYYQHFLETSKRLIRRLSDRTTNYQRRLLFVAS